MLLTAVACAMGLALPMGPAGDAPADGTASDFTPFDGVNRLSRFVLRTDGTLDVGSEKKILDVPASRGLCCHVGGDIDFDAAGDLYLSTGDDTNPFASDGYTPLDERASRNPAYDAQRSSGNTNDLRGKILRIKVNPDGTYGIPAGNLFAPGTARTRPEIYAMGFRNPFRMSVDRATGAVHVGDYGPDAGTANASRGPAGQVEFNRITRAGNFGWPYCTGRNDAHVDYDFAAGASGTAFDCAAPRNTSPHNTGLTDLPPAQPAWIPYDGASLTEFGNTAPTVRLDTPVDGRIHDFGAAIPFEVTVTDPEDGTIDCAKVRVTFIIGHDSHGHPQTSATGCTGTLHTLADGEHDPNADIFGVIDAEYTDNGANGQPALTAHDQHITQPGHRQAEYYGGSAGVQVVNHTPAHGGRTVGEIHDGDWISFTPYSLDNATGFTARVSSADSGGTLEVRAGSPAGILLGTATVPVTGGWETFQDVTASLTGRPAPPPCTSSSRAAAAPCSTWTSSPSPPPPAAPARAR